MQPLLGRLIFRPRGAFFAFSASSGVMSRTAAIRWMTVLRRLIASCSSLTGSYRLGDWTRPARSADSGMFRSLAGLEK
ncbi:hypothetical protein EES44_28075 [Streptomyces sp. ADI96-15]|nr:hypothetical protein EES44_28075 [Streptomyces sp. ADI96-15]